MKLGRTWLGHLSQVKFLTSSRLAETWGWPPSGKHGPQGLIHLPRLLPPMVSFIACHTHSDMCARPIFFPYTVSLRLAFSHRVRLCVTRILSVIFPCHSMVLSHHTYSLSHLVSPRLGHSVCHTLTLSWCLRGLTEVARETKAL